MGARAEYTMAQAVAMVNFLAEQRRAHYKICKTCAHADLRRNESDFVPKEEFCPDGFAHEQNSAKWKRRCKYAAKREGRRITV